MRFVRHRIFSLIATIVVVALTYSCSPIELDFTDGPFTHSGSESPQRIPNKKYMNVFLIYSCGYNNLSSALKEDIKDIQRNFETGSDRNALLIFSHASRTGKDFSTPVEPCLCNVYADSSGTVILDTLKVWPGNSISASAEMLEEVLTFVRDGFPASVYGMLFSSHGSGWTPAGYITKPDVFEGKTSDWEWYLQAAAPVDKPAVKSIGVQQRPGSSASYEIEIQDFADAIPMKLDYLIFDACLMGSIEVAYQLRGKCDRLVASQAEILSYGMDYETMCSYIFASKWPDLEGLCQRYYDYYNNMSSSVYRSATISLIDCNRLEPLADVCREIFTSCREGIAALEGAKSSQVQTYFRESDRQYLQWFYDLEDIIIKCGATSEQLKQLQYALEECVPYKKATEKLLGETPINHHCGLSMYLPFKERNYLNSHYKTLEWNKATGLVQ